MAKVLVSLEQSAGWAVPGSCVPNGPRSGSDAETAARVCGRVGTGQVELKVAE